MIEPEELLRDTKKNIEIIETQIQSLVTSMARNELLVQEDSVLLYSDAREKPGRKNRSGPTSPSRKSGLDTYLGGPKHIRDEDSFATPFMDTWVIGISLVNASSTPLTSLKFLMTTTEMSEHGSSELRSFRYEYKLAVPAISREEAYASDNLVLQEDSVTSFQASIAAGGKCKLLIHLVPCGALVNDRTPIRFVLHLVDGNKILWHKILDLSAHDNLKEVLQKHPKDFHLTITRTVSTIRLRSLRASSSFVTRYLKFLEDRLGFGLCEEVATSFDTRVLSYVSKDMDAYWGMVIENVICDRAPDCITCRLFTRSAEQTNGWHNDLLTWSKTESIEVIFGRYRDNGELAEKTFSLLQTEINRTMDLLTSVTKGVIEPQRLILTKHRLQDSINKEKCPEDVLKDYLCSIQQSDNVFMKSKDFTQANHCLNMDPLYLAITRFRQRNFDETITICTELLRRNPLDQAVWSLKTRALTENMRVDFLEIFDDGIAETIFTEDTIATAARPETSLRVASSRPDFTRDGPSPAIRPVTQSGRPLSGVTRPGSSATSRPGTSLDAALRSRATTARPISASTGRHVRLGTASMITGSDGGPFINVSRLNLQKYSSQENLSKALYEYLFYVENDAKHSLELANSAQKFLTDTKGKDWWWQVQLALSWLRLGHPRNAEKHFRLSIQVEPMLLAYIGLAKVYVKLDQPLAALEACEKGLDKFPNDVTLLTEMARVQEGLQKMSQSVTHYREILLQDSSNIEAIACIGMHHFYTDQPEVALRFYRRLLQMGVYTAELFVNLGLCCFYSQQYDMTLVCFQRALTIASSDCIAEVWYNLGQIAMGLSDTTWASQCFRLAIANDNNHAEAYNNMGVLEARKGKNDQALAFFQTATSLAPHLFEPLFNQAKIADSIGDLQNAYVIVQKALKNYPEHADSKDLFQKLQKFFETI